MLRNNDQSVRIFSLTQSRLLETLEFPISMNHASMSPDGKLLLAVGDRHRAFFYRRVRLPSALSDGASTYARYEWHEIAGLKLSLAEAKDPWQVHLRSAVFLSRTTLRIARNVPGAKKLSIPLQAIPLLSSLPRNIHADSVIFIASLLHSHHPAVRTF